MKPSPLLTRVMVDPAAVETLASSEWDLLIRQARKANLLGRLAAVLEKTERLPTAPPQPRMHLLSALRVAERQHMAVRWEIECIRRALAEASHPVVVLKGAAYILLELPSARGRLFSDVDILVPKTDIPAAELTLKMHGWTTTQHDAYDQRYYREWMHELPPMRHLTRETLLDLHHTILPETARLHPEAKKLFDTARPIPDQPELETLEPVDMVLHSATHLFHEGEFDHGLRDLCDIDLLLRDFGNRIPDFWQRLVPRAAELDLARPLHYALRHSRRVLGTPVPPEVAQASAADGPGIFIERLMDVLFERAFRPQHESCSDWLTKPALLMLFIRSHWLKMPFWLLLRHLLHKAFISPREPSSI